MEVNLRGRLVNVEETDQSAKIMAVIAIKYATSAETDMEIRRLLVMVKNAAVNETIEGIMSIKPN